MSDRTALFFAESEESLKTERQVGQRKPGAARYGKCSRKDTAFSSKVRVKWRGKSSPPWPKG